MRIVIAPDSYKGCLMAWDVAQAIAIGVRGALPDADIVQLPLGDGGEGTAGALCRAIPGSRMVNVPVLDPLGRQATAELAVLPGRRVVVEMAAASGLGLLASDERDVMRADTRGTGQLIRAALDLLHSHSLYGDQAEPDPESSPLLILGVGGSATVDGGLGMLSALGARFEGPSHQELRELGGAALEQLTAADLSGLDPRLSQTRVVLASDVTNRLLGPDGAAAVFGPQKGAGPADVQRLDAGLSSLRDVLARDAGCQIEGFPGAGAAGGVGGVAVGVFGASFRPGIELALELVGFESQACCADLVITGEGRFDRQTLRGKAVMGVAGAAARLGVPICALVGGIGDADAESNLPGRAVVLSIADGPLTLDQSQGQAARLLTAAGRRVARLFWFGTQARQQEVGS